MRVESSWRGDCPQSPSPGGRGCCTSRHTSVSRTARQALLPATAPPPHSPCWASRPPPGWPRAGRRPGVGGWGLPPCSWCWCGLHWTSSHVITLLTTISCFPRPIIITWGREACKTVDYKIWLAGRLTVGVAPQHLTVQQTLHKQRPSHPPLGHPPHWQYHRDPLSWDWPTRDNLSSNSSLVTCWLCSRSCPSEGLHSTVRGWISAAVQWPGWDHSTHITDCTALNIKNPASNTQSVILTTKKYFKKLKIRTVGPQLSCN